MAMVDPTKAKRNIDFETYVEPKGERINWFEQAKTISDAFTNVATSRQKRKDEIDDNTKQTIDDLNALEAYDNQTLMNMTIDGTNNAANVIYEAEQAMKRGELRPSEFAKLKQNISAGFTQFEKNAKAWEADFKRYTQRMQGVDGVQSSSLEQYLGERMESFGNLKNLQLVTNPDTGNLAFGRIDPETGELLTGPDDLISINRMSAILKQEIDKVDVTAKVKDVVTSLGEYIAAGNATSMGKDGSPTSIVTIEDFMQTEDAEKTILDKAKTIAYNSFTTGSVLTDNGVSNVHGENYKPGSQEEFDQWIAENQDKDPMDNPIIVMGYKKNGVIVEPAITERQQTAAEEYLVRQIKGALDYKETQKEFPPQKATNYEIARGDREKTYSNLMGTLNTALTGEDAESTAALNELASSINSRMSGNKNYTPIQKIEIEGDEVLIYKKGGEIERVDITDMSTRDIGSSIWNDVTGGEVSFADALAMYEKGGGSLGEYREGDRGGRKTNVDKIENADYDSKIRIDGADKSITDALDNLPNNVGEGAATEGFVDDREKIAQGLTKIMKGVFLNPATPGIVDGFKGEDIGVSVSEDGKNFEFTIGDQVYIYPQYEDGFKEGDNVATGQWDNVKKKIWPSMQQFIDQVLKDMKSGKKSIFDPTKKGTEEVEVAEDVEVGEGDKLLND